MVSTLITRNVTINGRRTSMKMEADVWDAADEICEREDTSLNALCSWLDLRRRQSSLTAAVRVFIVTYYRTLARDADTDSRAGSGPTTPRSS